MAKSKTAEPSEDTLWREVSTFLRAAKEPDRLTFKQVRLEVEKSLGLPEGFLRKGSKAKIKEIVHAVMDELDGEASNDNDAEGKGVSEEEEEEEEEEEKQDDGEDEYSEGEESSSRNRGRGGSRKNTAATAAAAAGRGARKEDRTKDAKRQKTGSSDTARGGRAKTDENLVRVLGETASARKQVSVKTWKGKVQVDIREYYRNKEGEFAPGAKGMSLNPSQWNALRNATQSIDKAIGRLR